MDPYTRNMSTYGTLDRNQRVDSKMRQLYGSNLNGITAPSAGIGVIVGTGILAAYMVPTVISVLVQNKFLGFDNRLKTKDMTKRAALLGAVMGIPLATIVAGSVAVAGGE